MSYKKSYLIGLMLRFQDWQDKRSKPQPKNQSIIIKFFAVINALFWVVVALVNGLIALLIESPIRMIIFPGKIKDKLQFWFRCWESMYRGCVGLPLDKFDDKNEGATLR